MWENLIYQQSAEVKKKKKSHFKQFITNNVYQQLCMDILYVIEISIKIRAYSV